MVTVVFAEAYWPPRGVLVDDRSGAPRRAPPGKLLMGGDLGHHLGEHAVDDRFGMAADCALASGDLRAARGHAERLRDLPFHCEEGHLATVKLLVVTALAGDWNETITLAERFREGWDRAGRPRASNLSRGAYAAVTVHGLRGDDDARAVWLDIVSTLSALRGPRGELCYGKFFDACCCCTAVCPSRR